MSDRATAKSALEFIRWSIVLIAAGLFCRAGSAADRVWQALTRDGSSISGTLQGATARDFKFKRTSGKNLGPSLSLDQLERLELPNRPRVLPGIGVRQFQFTNGDRLHAQILPRQNTDLKARQQNLLLSGPVAEKWPLPWNGLAAVSHSPGTRCVAEFDFEEDAAGWSGKSPQHVPQFGLEHSRSGQRSLKSSAEQPDIQYRLPNELTAGWIQFEFFVEAPTSQSTETVFRLVFAPTKNLINSSIVSKVINDAAAAKPLKASSEVVEVCLAGPTTEFDCRIPVESTGTRQRLTRRPGWHTLKCQLTSETVALMIDGDLLGTCQFSKSSFKALQSVEFTAGDKASPVWIDDFVLLEAASRDHAARLQYAQDEVLLTWGDQLFGLIQDIRLRKVILASGQRETQLSWPEISKIELAEGESERRPVSGLICRIELQPLWTSPDWHQADVLHGALVAYDGRQLTLDHSILGTLTLPVTDIRQLKPSFYGTQWDFAGRGVHLGDEVKSQFRTPIPRGKNWKRSFQLDTVPTAASRLHVTCLNLEPSGMATRPSALLKRLQMGEFLSEIRLNEKRLAVLNEHVSGHGTPEMPQEIVLKLSAGDLRQGENTLDILLQPSRDEVPEYDDWELLGLSLEIP
jgi:hypothetical protein